MGRRSSTTAAQAATVSAGASVGAFAQALIAWQPRRFAWVSVVSAASGLIQALGTCC